ncbi:hypothetical protein SDC9_49676 [bioreactor metagenome]|uniref:Radical SAM core domain-containing protein n=1 Tax=bioreactor metagenome TaxID=1076179 RepID=A0A644WIG8_9ZZZZ
MKIRRHFNDYNFIADQETGITFRWGKTLNENPYFAPIPELADISISNHCSKGCSFCYRNSKPDNSFMSTEDYELIMKNLKHSQSGSVFQVALGGGEPLEHPNIVDILDITRSYDVVPNFTTNGIFLTKKIADNIKGKVGAVAVSLTNFDDYSESNIELLINSEIRTNIHFVVDNQNIKDAIKILIGNYNHLLQNINAIVFLTYKPAGRGETSLVLQDNADFQTFLSLIDNNKCICRIGFDACFVPMLMRYTKTRIEYIDACEVGFFSVYIDEKLNVSPCSFSNGADSYNLREYDFYDIWLNKFKDFRSRHNNMCKQDCIAKKSCRGFCPYYPQITTCYK